MEYINGEDRNQTALLPESINAYIDENNPARVIGAYINSLELAGLGFARPEPNETGRPPYDPKDLLKLYVCGYLNRTRPSRRLETESRRNLEAVWLLCRLPPDHKTVARFRRENAAALKNVFRGFVKLRVELGLCGREPAAIDGSKFKAADSKDRNFTGQKLRERVARIDAKIEEYMRELEGAGAAENACGDRKTSGETKGIITGLPGRKGRYKGYADELGRAGETQKPLAGSGSRLAAPDGKTEACYNAQAAAGAKNKLAAGFEAANRPNDKNPVTPAALRAQDILETGKVTIIAGAGYGSVQDIIPATGLGASAHAAGTGFDICAPAKAGGGTAARPRKGGRRACFAGRNIALCPTGNVLYPGHCKKSKGRGVFYNRAACKQCACTCTKEARGFRCQVPAAGAAFSKEYNDKGLPVKQRRVTPGKEIIKQRKSIAGHPFGTIKRGMGGGYCLAKGLRDVNGEFSLAFLACNLKRVINILGCKNLMAAMA